MTERQVPFYCPYCGEESLRPSGATAGAWECASCARGFELRFTAVLRPSPNEPLISKLLPSSEP